jgi:glycosyltransferase involved in cell wall biosynthesis
MVRRLLCSAVATTAPSEYLASSLRKFRHDITVLANAIDVTAYPFRYRRFATPRLVWLRAFHRIYDPSLAVKTLALLAKDFPDIQLLMIGPDKGDGSYEAARSLAASLGVENRIEFSGRIPKRDVGDWINRGDIFLNTSTVDNQPVTLLEAMACGACVVSTDIGGIPFIAKNRINALLVSVGDADAFANAVTEILRDPDVSAKLSQNARRSAEAYDWSVVLPQWTMLLNSVRH